MSVVIAKKKGAKRVIPGFGLSLGIVVTMLSLLVLIPLASVLVKSFSLSWSEFVELMSSKNVYTAFFVSILCAFVAALINTVFGLILAWVLVRYDFWGRRLMDAMIELPFALPTAVAGITLTRMYSTKGAIGRILELLGVRVSYTRIGIIIAMVFIGIPFVVRAIQPVLERLDDSYEEAASMMGAGRFYTFRRVILPELFPAMLTGFALALARGIGEYGSVVYISGNSLKDGTQVISYVIMQKLNSGRVDYEGASAIALVMLVISFLLMLLIGMGQIVAAKRANS